MQRPLRDLHSQLGGDALGKLEVEILEALQGHCHLQRRSALLQLFSDQRHLIGRQEVRCGCGSQACGLDALHQPSLGQGFQGAVQIIQSQRVLVQLLQLRARARGHGIGQDLLQLLRLIKLRVHVLHLAVQERQGHLILRLSAGGGELSPRLGQNVDQALVMVARPPGATQHLVELVHIQPLDAHGQGLEDHLRSREVHARGQGGGSYNGVNLSRAKQLLDLLSLRILQAGMVGGGTGNSVGQSVAVLAGVGEDDSLAAVAGGRSQRLRLSGQLPQKLALFRPQGKY
ncbi:Uncharacterised protein [uncultured archaeon]|nr:Uncharacterised protein [uncultured archaeon]